MNHSNSKTGFVLVAAVVAVAGYLVGAAQSQVPANAQAVAPAEPGAGAAPNPGAAAPGVAIGQEPDAGMHGVIGVSIPNGGAALVKGKDGNAYIVDGRGMFVRASQSGKPLPLP